MHISSAIRKIFEGVASRREMYRMFNRHRGAPAVADGDAGDLFAGEWFEVAERDYNYMSEIFPPLFMRAHICAPSESLPPRLTRSLLSPSPTPRTPHSPHHPSLSN